jgi:hypothetical protein
LPLLRMDDSKGLDMAVLVPGGVLGLAEAELEDNLFPGVTVRVETHGVKAFGVKGVRRRYAGIRIGRHRHDRAAGSAREEIKITAVEPRVFLRLHGVKVMGHCVIPDQPVATASVFEWPGSSSHRRREANNQRQWFQFLADRRIVDRRKVGGNRQ